MASPRITRIGKKHGAAMQEAVENLGVSTVTELSVVYRGPEQLYQDLKESMPELAKTTVEQYWDEVDDMADRDAAANAKIRRVLRAHALQTDSLIPRRPAPPPPMTPAARPAATATGGRAPGTPSLEEAAKHRLDKAIARAMALIDEIGQQSPRVADVKKSDLPPDKAALLWCNLLTKRAGSPSTMENYMGAVKKVLALGDRTDRVAMASDTCTTGQLLD